MSAVYNTPNNYDEDGGYLAYIENRRLVQAGGGGYFSLSLPSWRGERNRK